MKEPTEAHGELCSTDPCERCQAFKEAAPYVGTMYPKSSLFLRQTIGEAKLGEKRYELTLNADGTPLVRSEQSGRTFAVRWESLIDIAIAAGFEDERYVCSDCAPRETQGHTGCNDKACECFCAVQRRKREAKKEARS